MKAEYAQIVFRTGWPFKNAKKDNPEFCNHDSESNKTFPDKMWGSFYFSSKENEGLRNMLALIEKVKKDHPDLDMGFRSPGDFGFIWTVLINDVMLVVISVVLVAITLTVQTGSLFLMFTGMFEILVSFPMGFQNITLNKGKYVVKTCALHWPLEFDKTEERPTIYETIDEMQKNDVEDVDELIPEKLNPVTIPYDIANEMVEQYSMLLIRLEERNGNTDDIAEIFVRRATLYSCMGKHDQAYADAKKAVSLRPSYTPASFRAAPKMIDPLLSPAVCVVCHLMINIDFLFMKVVQ